MLQKSFRAMGCAIQVWLDSDDRAGQVALNEVPVWFEEWERGLSRFRGESELSRINRRRVTRVFVSRIFADVMQEALAVAHWSEGLVLPTLLPALIAAGYDRTFELMNLTQKGAVQAQAHRVQADWRAIELDAADGTLTAPLEMQFDFGGVGKAWAARETMRKLQNLGPVLVNAGGDIACSRALQNGHPWAIGVHDPDGVCKEATMPTKELGDIAPLREDATAALLMTLALGQGSVATSGRDFRAWTRNGVTMHHLIDPRTGRPAQTDLLTATVIAQDPIYADAAAKVLMILGSAGAQQWLPKHPEFEVVLVHEDRRVITSPKAREFIWGEVPA